MFFLLTRTVLAPVNTTMIQTCMVGTLVLHFFHWSNAAQRLAANMLRAAPSSVFLPADAILQL